MRLVLTLRPCLLKHGGDPLGQINYLSPRPCGFGQENFEQKYKIKVGRGVGPILTQFCRDLTELG